MNKNCCQKCVGWNFIHDEPEHNEDCPCHTTPATDEAEVQESMKKDYSYETATPEQKREIGLTAAKEANAAQRKIATPATKDWEEEFDNRYFVSTIPNLDGLREFIRTLITKERAAERGRVVDFIEKHCPQELDPMGNTVGYHVVGIATLEAARDLPAD